MTIYSDPRAYYSSPLPLSVSLARLQVLPFYLLQAKEPQRIRSYSLRKLAAFMAESKHILILTKPNLQQCSA